MLQTKFQAAEPSSSGEENFKEHYTFEPKPPAARVILDPGAATRTNLV